LLQGVKVEHCTDTVSSFIGIYVRKSREKKFLEKKPGNKNFGKKSEFSQVLGKNVIGNKVLCFGFLGLFS